MGLKKKDDRLGIYSFAAAMPSLHMLPVVTTPCASAMISTVQRADGKFQMMFLRGKLGLTEDQKFRLKSSKYPKQNVAEEPCLWVHYDKDVESISITQCRPVDAEEIDGSDSDSEHGGFNYRQEGKLSEDRQLQSTSGENHTHISQLGAAGILNVVLDYKFLF
mmetsp:Transcript_15991/g.27900  ORF Transcript_15991/g.27900 Transcript_15991/m.27900 type:complete len:163 (+) Transcript_15991:134-622(+)